MTSELQPVPIEAVRIDDDFWNGRLEMNRSVTLKHGLNYLEKTGRLENFRRAANKSDSNFSGRSFNDSDVYKWLEAACYVLRTNPTPDSKLREEIDEVVSLIASAQDDGYLNTHFTLEEPNKKWTNLGMLHELYCAGHLIEAAVAHYRATSENDLLDVACSFADLIDDIFGPDGRQEIPGHEEIELALIKLYHETDEPRYLNLAEFFVNQRGRDDSRFKYELNHLDDIAGDEEISGAYRHHLSDDRGEYDGQYAQDHLPVREQDTVEGHSVRAMYLFAGMTDVARETSDDTLVDTLQNLWMNMTTRRMYITGGIGSTAEHEGFTEDYDLPNETSYAETCAAIGSILWNHRMLGLTGEGRYGDVIERILYNGFLSGVSLDGKRFFYANPLASDGEEHPNDAPRIDNQRQGWFETACCPPNIMRLLASFGKYIYMQTDGAAYINLYVSSETQLTLGGVDVTLRQESDYPWAGSVTIEVSPVESAMFELNLRIPGWCRDANITINENKQDLNIKGGYATVERRWEEDDRVKLELAMPVEQVEAHPAVQQTSGQIALQRGPVVYCVEGVDTEESLHKLVVPANASFEPTYEKDHLGGIVALNGRVYSTDSSGWDDTLYRPREDSEMTETDIRAVPYHVWGHRGRSEMRIWLRSDKTA